MLTNYEQIKPDTWNMQELVILSEGTRETHLKYINDYSPAPSNKPGEKRDHLHGKFENQWKKMNLAYCSGGEEAVGV